MKARSKLRNKRDDTPEKSLIDDNQIINDVDNNSKSIESYAELRITDESLLEFNKSTRPESASCLNLSSITVRHHIPAENLKVPTKRICVLKKAPSNVPAIPSSSLLDQNNLRFDIYQRPVQHSILGSVEEYFKMSLNKEKLTLDEIPSEYHHFLGCGPPRRPFSAMFPTNMTQKENGNIFSQREKTGRREIPKFSTEFDTNALKLWEQRMKERRQLQDHISKKVERLPEHLIFNSGEGFREKMEKRYLICKSIPFHGSGYGFRAGSEYWQQNEVVGTDDQNCLHMTNTQTEKGYPPPILHIGVTDKIKEEKGVPVFDPNSEKNKEEYHLQRYQELSDVIRELDPCQPDFTDLLVIGNLIKQQIDVNDVKSFSSGHSKMKNESLASQNMSRSETIQESERTNQLFKGPCLVINSLKLEGRSNEFQFDSQVEIRMIFNGFAKDKCIEKLTLLNRGTSILRYWWKKLDSYDPFNLENKDVRRFYFNTKDGILLPNQDFDFPIIFKSEKSGIFSEMWKIETFPSLCDSKGIVISMKGIALPRDVLANTRKKIDEYLKFQVDTNICRGILEDIIQNIDRKMSLTYSDDNMTINEREQFNERNKGIMFDLDNIHSFKKLNEELAAKEVDLYKDWDMDCGILRRNIVSAKSIKTIKKEEMCQKFFKHIDKAMILDNKADIIQRDQLYRIGYRNLLDFFGQMFEGLGEIRKFHEMPEIEIRIANDKKRSNMSRQRTTFSQNSKKQPSATSKSKSKEPSNLMREPTEILLNEPDDIDKIGSLNISDIDETTNDNDHIFNSILESNTAKYHSKSYQVVYSLLDTALNNIIEYWDEITQ